MPHSWKWRILAAAWISIIAPVLLLVAVECTVRAAGYGADTRYLLPVDSAYRPNPAFHQQFFALPVNLIMGWEITEFAAVHPKPAGTYRIVVLGESAAYGSPYGGYGFPRYLEKMLRDAFPDTRVEVLNAAVPGTNSNVLQVLASYFPQLEPDLVLLYMGNNESNPPFVSPAISKILPFIPRPALFRAEVAFNRLRMVQLARSRRHEQAPPLIWPREDTPDSLALNDFEANLGVIANSARRVDARVVLCTLGRNAFENGQPPQVADATSIPRTSFNKRILAFARRNASKTLRLVDVDRGFWEYSGKIVPPGYDLFCDPLHFRFDGNYIAAATVFPDTAAFLAEEGCRRVGTTPLTQVECERRMGLGAACKLSLVEPEAKSGPPSNERAAVAAHEALKALAARLIEQAGSDPRQAMSSDFEAALLLDGNDYVLRMQFMRWLLDRNDMERAKRESAELVKRFPEMRAANRLFAQTLERTGDADGAKRAYTRTLALYPDDALSLEALRRPDLAAQNVK